ncbi:MAG: SDR family NAD(P)-dependent oxidoreductase [Acidimicrobiia bacterium]|nr:SDR family NAD(P)-dependent oxidoreductase [Acidimicrobiia bacterium]
MTTSRIAVVTGAASGIGQAIAVGLGRLGWSVALGGRRIDALATTAKLVDIEGGHAFAHHLDVTQPGSVDAFFDAAASELGPCDTLVNNAGLAIPGLLVDTDADALQREIDTNLLGPLLCSRRALGPMLDAGRGDIVFISSDTARMPRPGMIGYSATKAALETVARVIDMETEGRGIRTTVVRVGPTLLTDFADGWKPGSFEHLLDLWPRFGIQRHFNTMQPADIANVVIHALTAPAHARVDTIEIQPVAPPVT